MDGVAVVVVAEKIPLRVGCGLASCKEVLEKLPALST
jgi:hypothetical protein